MNGGRKGKSGNGNREQITVSLPAELAETLRAFCRDKRVTPELVVERALAEYFREGDMSH
ncbi:MAG TPA: hypothetical protein VK863_09150 [Candidatus Limnocylindrales bacterium]|nr:hypothetical protein [Candidatus Limnocylindrales bacterium]